MTEPLPEPLTGLRGLRRQMGQRVRAASNVHRPDGRPDVLLFATPRGGSTWLYELVGSQPGFKGINEPLNLRIPEIRSALGIDSWAALYGGAGRARLPSYFRALARGELGHMNANVWVKNWRPLTHRAVFKVLHGAEHVATEIQDALDARVLVLMRHPIAVALSRTVLPRLDAYFEGDYLDGWLDSDGRRAAERVRDEGDALERAVLSWGLQLGALLRQRRPDWAVVTYEQMVVDGSPVIARVADRAELPDPARMLGLLHRPSTSIRGMSTRQTQKKLADRPSEERSRWLVNKWREKVDEATERRAMRVLEPLGIDAYRAGSVYPIDAYWVDPREPARGPTARRESARG